ncbi:hypothetical protein MNBD_GAMMA06-50 [hydrothermal vent metagenome]|uniref:Uncharacterized protein n=1 Tax=hydrothermal vent metagenome TaxID=652676 RepID=A0A3B0WN54_9ZZZZ
MNQGMQILNEALQDGSKEMGSSLLQLMDELNTTMQKSINEMKKRREQKMQNQDEPPTKSQKKQPDPQSDEGII